MGDKSDLVKEFTRDILDEKSFWQVLCLRKPLIEWNLSAKLFLFFCGSLLAFCLFSGLPSLAYYEMAVCLSEISINFTLSILGFLIAGFTIFATLLPAELFVYMWLLPHDNYPNYLKYNFSCFMRTFAVFFIGCVFSVVILVIGKSQEFCQFGIAVCGNSYGRISLLVNFSSFYFGVILCALQFIQLVVFIFDMYHVIMTYIRWRAMWIITGKDAEKEIKDAFSDFRDKKTSKK